MQVFWKPFRKYMMLQNQAAMCELGIDQRYDCDLRENSKASTNI